MVLAPADNAPHEPDSVESIEVLIPVPDLSATSTEENLNTITESSVYRDHCGNDVHNECPL